MIASTRPERPGWVTLKETMPQLGGGEFQVEVVPVQESMPEELHQDLLEGTDYLHEMLCVRRRASPPPVVGDGEEYPLAQQRCPTSHAFPSVMQTITAPERLEPRADQAGTVNSFLGSMPTFT